MWTASLHAGPVHLPHSADQFICYIVIIVSWQPLWLWLYDSEGLLDTRALNVSWMEGSSHPLILSAVRTTHCSALWYWALQFPYQAVMHPVKMLSVVPLKEAPRILWPRPNFFSRLRWNRHRCAFFTRCWWKKSSRWGLWWCGPPGS